MGTLGFIYELKMNKRDLYLWWACCFAERMIKWRN